MQTDGYKQVVQLLLLFLLCDFLHNAVFKSSHFLSNKNICVVEYKLLMYFFIRIKVEKLKFIQSSSLVWFSIIFLFAPF